MLPAGEFLARRRWLAARYWSVSPAAAVDVPAVAEDADPAAFLLRPPASRPTGRGPGEDIPRVACREHRRQRPLHPGPHAPTTGRASRTCRCRSPSAYERLLTLPLHAGMTDGDVDDVVRALDKVAEACWSARDGRGVAPLQRAGDRGRDPGRGWARRACEAKVLEPIEDAPLRLGRSGEFARCAACRRSSSRPPPIPPTTPSRGSPRTGCRRPPRARPTTCSVGVWMRWKPSNPRSSSGRPPTTPSPTLRWPRSGPGALDGGLDYVGIDGWPLGIAAEACRFPALAVANREATDPAGREHVTPFLCRQPERFRIGRAPPPTRAGPRRPRRGIPWTPSRTFARALAAQLSAGPPVSTAVLEAIIEDDPGLLEIDAGVAQKPWGTSQLAEEARWTS